MKKLCLVFTAMLTILLAACGEMSQDDVVGKITSNLENANSYFADGVMEIDSDGQMFQYHVEVAFQKGDDSDNYRVTLRNETTNNEQIILKNENGVFVLTPALNKQFKFQSDWPLTSSQVYLYQSLLADILSGLEAELAVFVAEEETFLFETTANYHGNQDLLNQTIRFDQKTLAPTEVAVMDSEGMTRISMNFTSFEFNHDFEDGFFDSATIMEEAQSTMGEGVASIIEMGSVEIDLDLMSLPEGTELTAKQEVGERLIMTFSGEQSLTLIQEPVSARSTLDIEPVSGEPVLINGTVGTLNNNAVTWVLDGMEFFMVSDTLESHELISVASSISTVTQK